MVLSVLMTIMMWLIKLAAKSAVGAVAMALTMLVKLISMVPPEEYARLAMALEAFLISMVTKLGASHPAVKALAASPTVIADAAVAIKQSGTPQG